MQKSTRTSRLMAATFLAGTLFASAPAFAQDTTTTNIELGSGASVKLSIPAIDATGSSLTGDEIKAVITGDVAAMGDAFRGLNADEVRIPELRVSSETPDGDGKTVKVDVVYRDFVFKNVKDGVAEATSMGGGDFSGPEGLSGTFGKMSTGTFDVATMVGFYSTASGPASAEKTTIYADVVFDGMKINGKDGFGCDIGKMSLGSFKARPLQTSFTSIFSMIKDLEGKSEPAPGDMAKFISFYVDMLDAFESTPVVFDGMNCAGKDDKGRPLTVAFGKMEMEGFSGGRYPALSMNDMSVAVEGDGFVKAKNITFKGMDLTGVATALKAAGDAVDVEWFATNYRKIIPSFDGLSIEGLSIDVPDEQKPGERIVASVGAADLTLKDYENGIPSDISFTGSNIKAKIPADSEDETAKTLIALGYGDLDVGYGLKLKWDRASSTIAINELSATGAAMGTVSIKGTIGNASEVLFGDDLEAAQGAAMMMTAKDISISASDEGLAPKLLGVAAAGQGKDVEAFKTEAANMVAGGAMMILKGSPEAKKLGDAVAAFINGAKNLTVTVKAKDDAGIGMMDFMAAQQDPTAIADKVTIDASN